MTEEEAFPPFPGLDAAEEQEGLDDDDRPLPGDPGVLEDVVVDDGAVEDEEDGHVAEHDGVEEELVAPDVVHPLREVLLRLGLHAEEGAAEVDQLPGEEEREPCHRDECRGPRSEYRVASLGIRVITVFTHVAVAEAECNQGEGGQTQCRHPEAVDQHIDDEFVGENAAFEVLRWPLEDVWSGDFETKTHVG